MSKEISKIKTSKARNQPVTQTHKKPMFQGWYHKDRLKLRLTPNKNISDRNQLHKVVEGLTILN